MRPWRTRSRTRTLASRWVSILPPHSKVATFLPWKRSRFGEHRRETGRAGALDDGLFDADEHGDRTLEVALGDEHHVIGKFPEDARRELARLLDGNALGERIAAQRHLAALDRAFHRRVELGLDSDQLDVRLDRARGDRDAGHQPAAADRDDDRVEVRRVLEHLEAERARAGDHLRIVEGVDEDVAVLERQLARLGEGIVDDLAVKHDLGAVPAVWVTFTVGVDFRHHDDRRNPEPLCVIGDRLRVIAGRRGDDSALALFGRQLQQFVERAALLVGGRELQVLELEPDLRADDFGQSAADEHRRADDGALDPLCGGADVFDRRWLQAAGWSIVAA